MKLRASIPTGMAGLLVMPGPDADSVACKLPKAVTGPMAIALTRPPQIVNSSATSRGIVKKSDRAPAPDSVYPLPATGGLSSLALG